MKLIDYIAEKLDYEHNRHISDVQKQRLEQKLIDWIDKLNINVGA